MKRFIIPLLLITATFATTAASAQVYVHARINLPVPPIPRFFPPAPPAVVFQQPYAPAQPYYDGYDGGQVVVTAPGYGYGRERYDHRYYERSRENCYRDYRGNDRGYYRDHERGRDHGREHRRNW